MTRATLLFIATLSLVNAAPAELAVIVQTGEVFSPLAWRAMEAESDRIVQHAGIRLRFIEHSKAAGQEFGDLVVLRMTGKCSMDGRPASHDVRGPFASVSVSGSVVLPFGEVHCDRIRGSVQMAMGPGVHRKSDAIFGRALGRVVAHELYHILGNTKGHGMAGVATEAFSARQLIAGELNLANDDCAKIVGRQSLFAKLPRERRR